MLSRPARSTVRVGTRLLSSTAARPKPLSPSTPPPSQPTLLPSLPRAKARERIRRRDEAVSPVSPFLTDSFGRQHDYLRISLTEKCNLRCTYCMPENGVPLLPKDNLLATDEVERVARLFVQNGVSKIRLTGGEPTVRLDLVDVVARLGLLPLTSLGMTSNGIALKRKLPALVAAGLTHLNLSLDTLDPFKYELMTRRRGFEAVMEALEVAKGLKGQGLKTKINMVVIRGVNDMEVADFVELTRDSDITVRFIEYMPFEDNRWSSSKLVSSRELLSLISSRHSSSSIEKLQDAASDTTRAYRVPGYKGSFGFISSMSDHFCGTCSRLRVGADGGVKVCLFGPPVLNLRPLLRSPDTTDDALLTSIGSAVWGKKFAHNGLGASSALAASPVAINHRLENTTRRTSRLSPHYALSRGGAVPVHLLSGSNPSFSFAGLRTFSSSSAALSQHPPERKSKTIDEAEQPASPASTSSSSSPSSAPSPTPSTLTHIDPTTGKASMVSVSAKAPTLRSATAVGYIKLNQRAWDLIDLGDSSPSAPYATASIFQQSSSSPSDSSAPSIPSDSPATPTMRTQKGDVLSIAQLAGIMGAKHTSLLIPLCHPLSLSYISVRLTPVPSSTSIRIEATAECVGPTGVEMEALTAVSTAALTVWDMCKAVAGEEMEVSRIKVVRKSGGRSGDWVRED
ncbi:hypothetical protein JCM8547_008150 [Rhodosporidiobolus lusitaniae]